MIIKERQLTKRATNQVVGTTTLGGFSVPDDMMLAVKSAIKNYSGLMQQATVLFTDNGRPLPIPYVNDTGNVGELVAEEGSISTQALTFAQVTLNGWKFSSKIVKCSREFLQDSVIDAADFIGKTLGERIIRAAAPYFIVGSGTAHPKGLENIVDVNNIIALNAGATFDSFAQFVQFRHTLDPAYRASPNCAYITSKTGLQNLIAIKDTANRPILVTNLNGPRLNGSSKADWVIYGQPLYIDDNIYSGTGLPKPFIYYGDLSKYIIRIAIDVQPLQLNELYAATGQIGFVAHARIDGNLMEMVPAPIVSARYDN